MPEDLFSGNMGLHVIKNPTGTYSFVGTIPAKLAKQVPASRYDSMSGRAFVGSDGKLYTHELPTFKSEEEARDFASKHGFSVSKR